MNTLRTIFYKLSPKNRLYARKIFYWPSFIFNRKRYPNGIPLPPKSLIFTGGGDFLQTGFKFLDLFKKYDLISPESTILDIGSGMGRIAAPLTSFISQKGKYSGLDIMPNGIDWCTKNISSRFPNFEFVFVDLKNDLYRNHGNKASELTFPFPSEHFDFIFLVSVFTHMLADEVGNYFSEMSRTLKSGKTCFVTLFLFDDPKILFNNQFGQFNLIDENYALMSKDVKSANVAFSENYIAKLCKDNNFTLKVKSPGSWRDNRKADDFQDIIIIEKL